jgi:hypothetical protein
LFTEKANSVLISCFISCSFSSFESQYQRLLHVEASMTCRPRVLGACCLVQQSAAHLSFMIITVEWIRSVSSPIIPELPACSSNLNRISGIDKSLGPRKQSHWSSHFHTFRVCIVSISCCITGRHGSCCRSHILSCQAKYRPL